MLFRSHLTLKSYPAGKGDSFLLSWGEDGNKHHLLIDSGIPSTYRFIKPDLIARKKLDAIILTHVDYDHLGGLFKLVADNSLELPKDYSVFMNTPSLALTPPDGDKVDVEHGIDLEKKLKDAGITCKPFYQGFTADNLLTIDELQLQVLSPPRKVIDELLRQWTAHKLYERYHAEAKGSDKVSKPIDDLAAYEEIIKAGETIHKWEDDLINSSSMAFIACYGGCNILFLGDANPNLIVEELERLGYSASNRLKVDLVKLSHHGCKHNSGKALFSAIECNSYLISTNGAGAYYHPDRETIVRLAEYARPANGKTLYIYLNHDLDTSNFITTKESADWNIKLIHQETFDFYNC